MKVLRAFRAFFSPPPEVHKCMRIDQIGPACSLETPSRFFNIYNNNSCVQQKPFFSFRMQLHYHLHFSLSLFFIA